jgi:hypothetical protein
MHLKGLDRWFAVSSQSSTVVDKLITRRSIGHIPSSRPRGKQQPSTISSSPLLHQRSNSPDHPGGLGKEIEFKDTLRGCTVQEDEEGVGLLVRLERVMGMGMGVGLVYRMRLWKSFWICRYVENLEMCLRDLVLLYHLYTIII